MTFTNEIYTLLIRYTKDLDGTDITLAELQNIPWWRCVWGWWKAKAYYQMDGYYTRFEDAPMGLPSLYVINDVLTIYNWTDKYEIVNTVDKDTCKAIYGK